MRCTNCAYTSDRDFTFCPSCGFRSADTPKNQDEGTGPAAASGPAAAASEPAAPAGEAVAAADQARLQAERIAFVRKDYDPSRDGRWPKPAAAPGGSAPAGQPAAGVPAAPPESGQRPSTTGMIVFSIINMLGCGFGISMILGIVALVFAIMAASENTYAEARQKLNIARILNIVGLVFNILQLVVIVMIIVGTIFMATSFSYYDPGFFSNDFPMS